MISMSFPKKKNLLPVNFYTGTSGLQLPVKNKSLYPEEFQDKSRLTYYGSLMNSIEINSSFYKLPRQATVARWASEVPEGFRFTFKLSKEITHCKELFFEPEMVDRFMEVIDAVEEKRGCVLVQFPPSVRIGQMGQLGLLMEALREADPDYRWNIAFEFRHDSLYHEDLYQMLEDKGMAMVIHDKKSVASPMLESDLPFVYLRFHGPEGSYRGSYEEDVLSEYATYISEWLSGGKTVYTYFNNTMGEALPNLFTLWEFLHDRDSF
jgi:uncharacterized protein YecE (DUF72 family)